MEEELTKRREESILIVDRFLARKGKELLEEYDVQAQKYDQLSLTLEWIGPKLAVETVQKYVPDTGVTILDLCGGTGDVGLLLKNAGYKTVDVLDGSKGMLMVAVQKQVYRNYFCQLLGETPQDPQTYLKDDLYDLVVMSGGQLSTGKFSEMIRMVKPGGYCVTIVYEGEGDFEGTMAWLEEQEKQGRVKVKEREDIGYVCLDGKSENTPGNRVVWRKI